jgi:RNA polymerase sigma factor (sigma-70 family)
MAAGTATGNDADLVAQFVAGDEQAIRTLYARYAGPILGLALRVLGNRALADEAVQTTMLKAWRASGSFDTSRELAPWLYAIARRVAIDIYRREKRPSEALPLTGDERAVAVVPLSFERTWEVWEVRSALQQLPVDEREVVRLSHLVGMTHPEIAERLGVPVGTVKSRSARAHRRLAAQLRHVVQVVD